MAVEFGSFFDSMYSAAVAQMSANAGALVSDGQDLAGVLLLITLGWTIAIWMLSSDGVSALMDSFGIIARYSIVAVLLGSWLATVGGFFQGNANDLSQRLAGTSSISDTVNTIMVGAGRLLASERMSEECTDTTSSADPQLSTCNKKPGASVQSASWSDLLLNFPMVMMTWLLRLVALLTMGLLLAAYLSVIFMAEIMFGLGMTLGPVLVPWLIWQRTEWLFDGWLKFMITAMLTKVVAAFMVVTTTGLVMTVKKFAEAVPVSSGEDLLAVDEIAALLLCVVCAIGVFLMWEVPRLAQSLIAGGSFPTRGVGSTISAPASKATAGLNNMREERIKREARDEKNAKKDDK